MTKTPTEIFTALVDLLTPLSSDERRRTVGAVFVLLGETAPPSSKDNLEQNADDAPSLPPKARQWMKQNGLSRDTLDQVFHVENGNAETLAEAPGKSQKEKTINAYVLAGAAQLLANGEAHFTDKAARQICITSGCFSSTNHATYLKDKGSDFTGSRESGWLLTAPGLKRAANLIKLIAGSHE